VSSVNSNEFRRQDLTAYTTFDDNTDIDMDKDGYEDTAEMEDEAGFEEAKVVAKEENKNKAIA
jgi:hypothetical protein